MKAQVLGSLPPPARETRMEILTHPNSRGQWGVVRREQISFSLSATLLYLFMKIIKMKQK